jgi:DegV family protein with EDD domain
MTVAVLVDSAAALPQEAAARHGIGVVPLQLVVGDDAYADGDLELPDVLDRIGDGLSTSAPTPGAWLEALRSRGEAVDAALLLTVSERMSATYRSAQLAAEAAPVDARVIDTGTAAGAEALVALAAAEAATAGADLDACAARARTVAAQVRLVATLEDLGQLVASGRVPAVAGWAGKQLDVNPLFEFRHGVARVLRPSLSRQAALDRIAARCRADRPEGPTRLHAAALEADAAEDADWLLRQVHTGEGDVSFRAPFSPVMVAHTGRGLVGLAWWWE